MAITFPRTFPTSDFSACSFDIVRGDVINRNIGGQVQTMELADPFWYIKATTKELDAVKRAQWQAWKDTLRGSFNRFYGYDPEKPYPLYYGRDVLNLTKSVGGGAFTGTATLVDASGTTVSLSGLPASFHHVAGDHISFGLTTGRRCLRRIVEDVVGASDGTSVVTVEPPIVGTKDVTVPVQMINPTCEMVLTPNTFSAPAGAKLASIYFEGMEPTF